MKQGDAYLTRVLQASHATTSRTETDHDWPQVVLVGSSPGNGRRQDQASKVRSSGATSGIPMWNGFVSQFMRWYNGSTCFPKGSGD